MISDIILNRNCRFTKEEKEKCIAVKQIIYLSEYARSNGYALLEREVMNESNNYFLRIAIKLLVDCTDRSLMEYILENLILSEDYNGEELLEKLIFAHGVLMLKDGENSYFFKQCIYSLFGETFMKKINEEKEWDNQKKMSFMSLDLITQKTTLPECAEFANYIKDLQDRSIEMILRFINVDDLSCALKGCGRDVIFSIIDNMSLYKSNYLLKMIAVEENELVNIIDAQKRILDYLKNLEKSYPFWFVHK